MDNWVILVLYFVKITKSHTYKNIIILGIVKKDPLFLHEIEIFI